jgi:hypothetical protein
MFNPCQIRGLIFGIENRNWKSSAIGHHQIHDWSRTNSRLIFFQELIFVLVEQGLKTRDVDNEWTYYGNQYAMRNVMVHSKSQVSPLYTHTRINSSDSWRVSIGVVLCRRTTNSLVSEVTGGISSRITSRTIHIFYTLFHDHHFYIAPINDAWQTSIAINRISRIV